jgi:hypothetical protein
MMQSPRAPTGWLALVLAVVLFGVVILMAKAEVAAPKPVYNLTTIVTVGILGFAAAAWGLVKLGARGKQAQQNGDVKRADYSHVLWLLGILVVGLGGAATVRYFLVPKTLGEFGYYRGDAAREARAGVPQHQGKERCRGCHPEEPKAHAKDVHSKVECETCHGAAAEHLAHFEKEGMFGSKAIFVPKTRDPCLWCHRRLAARPSSFPQVDPDEHYAFLGVGDPSTPCMKCHSPHEPLFLDRPVHEARMHPVIQQCTDCHKVRPGKDVERPEDHPAVFECSYCHQDLARDFAKRTHHNLDCSRCHQVYRESPTAVRIVKHRDPRFCLLCHAKKPFRTDAAPPLVDWPAHGQGKADTCIDCHADNIHGAKPEPPAPETP